MLEPTAVPSFHRNARRVFRTALGLFLLYSVYYYSTIQRAIPAANPVADRYLSRVQHEDWRAVEAMQPGGAATATVDEWKRIRRDYGAIVSFRADSSRDVTLPLYTRSRLDYEIVCEKGAVRVEMDLKPTSGGWKVLGARPYFRPPAPFDSMGGGASSGHGPRTPRAGR